MRGSARTRRSSRLRRPAPVAAVELDAIGNEERLHHQAETERAGLGVDAKRRRREIDELGIELEPIAEIACVEDVVRREDLRCAPRDALLAEAQIDVIAEP